MVDKARKVFVVHGRNAAARDAVFEFLRAVDLQPIEWSQAISMTGEGTPYIGDILDVALDAAQAIVVLMTPDEITYLRSDYSFGDDDPDINPAAQARPNVLFEAGMALGRNPKRTVMVELGRLRPFSDIAGRHVLRLRDEAQSRQEFVRRLQTAGCSVDTSGTDWMFAGDFTPPPEPGGGLPLGKKIPAASRKRVSVDVQYMARSKGLGRLQIINRGTEDIYEVDISIPSDVGGFHIFGTDELPLARLPAGRSFSIRTGQTMGGGGMHYDYFDVTVKGRLADGTAVNEDVFVSLVS